MALYMVHFHCSHLTKDDEEYYQELVTAPNKAAAVLQAVLLHLDVDIDEGYIYDQYGRVFDMEDCLAMEVKDKLHQKVLFSYMHPVIYDKTEVKSYLDYVFVNIIEKHFQE